MYESTKYEVMYEASQSDLKVDKNTQLSLDNYYNEMWVALKLKLIANEEVCARVHLLFNSVVPFQRLSCIAGARDPLTSHLHYFLLSFK